jgi:hypothetical protein
MIHKKNPIEIINKIFSIYNYNEKLALKEFSNFKLRAFHPNTFQYYNFPIFLNSPEEVFKYLDTMQENRINKNYFYDLGGYLLEDEMKAIENIATRVSSYAKFFKKRTVPIGIGHMISSISTIRSLIAISKQKKKKLKVIEIGPGSGMLGLLANWFNINYTSFDVTNAFAIQICSLYRFLFDKDFVDLSSIPYLGNLEREKKAAKKSRSNIEYLKEKIQEDNKMTFVPWWHFLNEENIPLPRYDVVIMNHCFFEIKETANRYILKRLNQNDEKQLVLCSYWGDTVSNNYSDISAYKLELEFGISQEKIISSNDIYIPKTIHLFSYKNNHKFRNLEFFEKNIDKRLGFEEIKLIKKQRTMKYKIILKFAPFILNFYAYFYNTFFRKDLKPAVLGKEIKKISNENIIYSKTDRNNLNKIDFKLFCSKIKNVEQLNGAPSFTEDEFFCNQVNNKNPF